MELGWLSAPPALRDPWPSRGGFLMVSVLADLPLVSQVTKYLDGCSCARASKEEVAAIKAELESKDAAIERLESEIRQKDLEKDNLMTMQKVLQEQISQIRADLEAQSEDATPAAMKPAARKPAAGKVSAPLSDQEKAAQRMQARQRGKLDRRAVEEKAAKGELVGQKRQKSRAAERIGARARGKFDRRKVEERKAAGDLPGMKRLAAQARYAPRRPSSPPCLAHPRPGPALCRSRHLSPRPTSSACRPHLSSPPSPPRPPPSRPTITTSPRPSRRPARLR